MYLILIIIILVILDAKFLSGLTRPQKQHIRCIAYMIFLVLLFTVKYLIIIEVIK